MLPNYTTTFNKKVTGLADRGRSDVTCLMLGLHMKVRHQRVGERVIWNNHGVLKFKRYAGSI